MTHSTHELLQCIKQQITACQQLRVLLDREREALIQNEPQQLEDLAAEKFRIFEQIEAQQQIINQYTKNRDLYEFINSVSTEEQNDLSTAYELFMSLLKDTQMQNEINGTVIAINLTNTRRLLQILKGNHQDASLYNERGHII